MLTLAAADLEALFAAAYGAYPLEFCALLAGAPDDDRGATAAVAVYPCRNAAESSKRYVVEPRDHLRAERDAEDRGLQIIGVVHSHTHSEPFPSPTDVESAPDPEWHYVIVGLRRESPEVRSYRIVAGRVTEEAIALD